MATFVCGWSHMLSQIVGVYQIQEIGSLIVSRVIHVNFEVTHDK